VSWVVHWTDSASARLEAQAMWFAQKSVPAAMKFVESVRSDVDRLSVFPAIGPVWRRFPTLQVRTLVTKNHVVYYDIDEERRTVSVLSIRHHRQREPSSAEIEKAQNEGM